MLYHLTPRPERIVTLSRTTFDFPPVQARREPDRSPPPHAATQHLAMRRPPQSVAGQA
jgi:hypothetical protein